MRSLAFASCAFSARKRVSGSGRVCNVRNCANQPQDVNAERASSRGVSSAGETNGDSGERKGTDRVLKQVVSFPGPDGRIDRGYAVRVLQWNVDSDSENVYARTNSLIKTIGETRPDVIFLQEVSAIEAGPRGSSFDLLTKRLVNTNIYELLADNILVERHPYYFAVMLLRKRLFSNIVPSFYRFKETKMGRHLIMARATLHTEYRDDRLCFLTSHMESLASGFQQRFVQMQYILRIMRTEKMPSIFGGDTNLRAREVRVRDVRNDTAEHQLYAIDATDDRVSDAWIQAGSPEEAKFSWDTRVNDNKEWIGDTRPYARFDRLFSSPGCTGELRRPRAMKYQLVGTERGPTEQFPSDHFGVLCDFNITLPRDAGK